MAEAADAGKRAAGKGARGLGAADAGARGLGLAAFDGARELGRLALWTPVALGLGVWLFFALPHEPPVWLGIAGGLSAAGLWALRARSPSVGRVFMTAAALIAMGFGAAQWRAWSVAAPVWRGDARVEIAFSGRVVLVDAARSGAPRLTLERLDIPGLAPEETPHRIRATLLDEAAGVAEKTGERVRLRARISPPPGPAEPGAFDFRRKAWFDGLGGLALVRAPPEILPAEPARGWLGLRLALQNLRGEIADRARAAQPGQTGAVIAALLVGDRSGLAPKTVEALRDANLAHLLAISGLHMGLICLTAFGLARLTLALHPVTASAWPAKKIAAVAALAVGAAYLALSGATVPTQRAFLMAAVAFGAVLVDRPAVTLRAVAAAATLILLWRPESLFDAGFQLSFAAATAMVAFFEATRPIWLGLRRRPSLLRRLGFGLGALAASSAVAGLATAPFAAFLFNRLSRYGLLANLLAVPLMGLLVMPAGLAALLLMPFGWEAPALAAMALGVDWILGVARFVASLPHASIAVASGPKAAIGLIVLGGLALCLTRAAPLRIASLAPVLAGLALWQAAERPDLLIAPDGRLVGVVTPEGRALDRARGAGYAAELWLRRDGEKTDQESAARRWPDAPRSLVDRALDLPHGWRLRIWLQRTPYDGALRRRCPPRTALVLPRAWLSGAQRARLRETLPADCVLIDRRRLARTGALSALWRDGEPVWRSARAVAGRRLWTDPALRFDD